MMEDMLLYGGLLILVGFPCLIGYWVLYKIFGQDDRKGDN